MPKHLGISPRTLCPTVHWCISLIESQWEQHFRIMPILQIINFTGNSLTSTLQLRRWHSLHVANVWSEECVCLRQGSAWLGVVACWPNAMSHTENFQGNTIRSGKYKQTRFKKISMRIYVDFSWKSFRQSVASKMRAQSSWRGPPCGDAVHHLIWIVPLQPMHKPNDKKSQCIM